MVTSRTELEMVCGSREIMDGWMVGVNGGRRRCESIDDPTNKGTRTYPWRGLDLFRCAYSFDLCPTGRYLEV